ncbi:flavodoxin family protein [Desulfuromonas sp.]|uniref:flavodoxin family protein n=1 Tax=Desulfuromonas sp. TaxID=892 RepID=UPI0025B883D1|nr:flavodoxin family protein [Desulfuromonas sp.]
MKIVCVLGSPHGLKGNTSRLLGHVLEGAEALGAEAEIVSLEPGTVQPCDACDACHKIGRCKQKDAFEAICERIAAADGLVLASPNYIQSVSAQMKAFMDRCCGVVHRLGFEGKYGASIVTSGGGGDDPIIDYMNRFLVITGVRPVGGVHATMGALPEGQFTDGLIRSARELGEKLVKAWRGQRVDPETEREMEEFRQRMRQLVTFRRDEWLYEYAYWQEKEGEGCRQV